MHCALHQPNKFDFNSNSCSENEKTQRVTIIFPIKNYPLFSTDFMYVGTSHVVDPGTELFKLVSPDP